MGNNITNRQLMCSESEQLYLKSRALSYFTTFKKLKRENHNISNFCSIECLICCFSDELKMKMAKNQPISSLLWHNWCIYLLDDVL